MAMHERLDEFGFKLRDELERTLQEMYIRPFAIALRDGDPGAVMCGFQQVNGVYGCEDETLLQGVLKDQHGFEGWVMSDYGSIETAAFRNPDGTWGLVALNASRDEAIEFAVRWDASSK